MNLLNYKNKRKEVLFRRQKKVPKTHLITGMIVIQINVRGNKKFMIFRVWHLSYSLSVIDLQTSSKTCKRRYNSANMDLSIRPAQTLDYPSIASLIIELAASSGETTPITSDYVRQYLEFPGCGALVAVENQQVVGLLSYSLCPNLFHAGDSCTIEELIVAQSYRNRGIGGALIEELLRQLSESGCVEVSVTTMPDNQGAIAFYRSHGLTDEAVYLEKHFRD